MDTAIWKDLRVKLRWYDLIAVILVVGGILLLAGAIASQYLPQEAQVEFVSSQGNEGVDKIWVEVEGAVLKPGVYQLQDDSRVKDALIAAGGLSDNANRELISKTINMVERVKDGQKIYLAKKDTPQGDSNILGDEIEYSVGVLVNINTASLSELDSLWGVGVTRAQALIDNRPYGSIEDLTLRGVWPENVVEKNRAKLSVY